MVMDDDVAQATTIKICGLTRASDARASLQAGADWIGLNFVAGPRKITMDSADRILDVIAEPARAVALLRIDEESGYDTAVDHLVGRGARRFQLYDKVTPSVVAGFVDRGLEVIVVRTVADGASLRAADRFLKSCGDHPPTYVLLDAASDSQLGGTGQVAHWPTIVKAGRDGRLADWPPLILAGGLNPDNVGDAVRTIAPWGVDVSSGVESRPGRKDPAKTAAFVQAVRRAI